MKNKTKNLYGLVLAGGKSSRMKKDKATLSFHDKPQAQHAYDLLDVFCERTFLSMRKEQDSVIDQTGMNIILDQEPFLNIGPLAGLMSALTQHPDTAWLVLACDLPFVTKDVLENLISQRNAECVATAYKSTYNDLPEPLCAIYEPQVKSLLKESIAEGRQCPRKILIKADTYLLPLTESHALDNINRPEEYEQAKKDLEKNVS